MNCNRRRSTAEDEKQFYISLRLCVSAVAFGWKLETGNWKLETRNWKLG